jgi:hypothetical protein
MRVKLRGNDPVAPISFFETKLEIDLFEVLLVWFYRFEIELVPRDFGAFWQDFLDFFLLRVVFSITIGIPSELFITFSLL